MEIFRYVVYLSIFFWVFTPIRQYKTKYIYYFFILAIADPIALILLKLIGSGYNMLLYNSLSLLLIPALIRPSIPKMGYFFIFIIIISIAFISGHIFSYNEQYIINAFIHLILLFIVIKIALVSIFIAKEIKLFNIILILYEAIMVMRMIGFLTVNESASRIFMISVVAQIVIAIFFTIVREDNTKLIIRLKR